MSNLIKNGTPRTLTETLENGFSAAGLTHTPEQIEIIRIQIQDFLAQKFQVAIMQAKTDSEVLLQHLFVTSVQRKSEE